MTTQGMFPIPDGKFRINTRGSINSVIDDVYIFGPVGEDGFRDVNLEIIVSPGEVTFTKAKIMGSGKARTDEFQFVIFDRTQIILGLSLLLNLPEGIIGIVPGKPLSKSRIFATGEILDFCILND